MAKGQASKEKPICYNEAMEIFSTLLVKLIPLYLIILLGYLSVKLFKTEKETIASILIYIMTPVILFNGTYNLELTSGAFFLPFSHFITCVIISLVVWACTYKIWKDGTSNIAAFASSMGNSGYFGIPVALMIFGEEIFPLAVITMLGGVAFQITLGYFITANGNHTVKESLHMLAKFPAIYTFALGLLLNIYNIDIGTALEPAFDLFTGAYSVLGMMMIGMGLAGAKLKYFDLKFIALTFFNKFFVWPILTLGIIYLDTMYFGVFTENMQKIMILMAIVPIAANTVAFATEHKVQPEKASIAVFLSTLFALIYIPLVATFFLY